MDVSIIIPVYNAEQYVNKCLDHILHYDKGEIDLEIIIVDDGSTDRSLSFIQSYTHAANLIVITGKNEGVAAARNKGIKKASGRYLMFVDVDDFLETKRLKACVAEADKYETDVLIFDYDLRSEKGRNQRKNIFRNLPQRQTVYTGKEMLKSFYGYDGYMWMALYNRGFVLDNQLLFEKGTIIWEDLNLILKILLRAKRVVYFPEVLYYYIRRGDSLSGKTSFEKTESALRVLVSLRKLGNDQAGDLSLRKYFDRCYSRHLYQTIKHILRARFPREQSRALFADICTWKMLPLDVDGNLKEKWDKKLLNASLSCFIFLFSLKKGLWLKMGRSN